MNPYPLDGFGPEGALAREEKRLAEFVLWGRYLVTDLTQIARVGRHSTKVQERIAVERHVAEREAIVQAAVELGGLTRPEEVSRVVI